MAIRQALNPSLLTELEEEEEEEEEEEKSEEPVEKKENTAAKKLKGKKKPTPEPKKKVAATTNGKPTPAKKGKENATATKRRSRNLQKLEDEDEKMVDDTAVSENVDRKKRVSILQTVRVSIICDIDFFFSFKSASPCRLKRRMKAVIHLLLKVILGIIIERIIKSLQNIKRYTIFDTDYSVWYITRRR